MNKQTEALKMAIEAMNEINSGWYSDEIASAIIACKRALKQPAQEPVACPYPCGWNNLHRALIEQGSYLIRRRGEDTSKDEVFDEFLCSVNDIARYLCEWGKKLTHPAPSWQGLSDDEIKSFGKDFFDIDICLTGNLMNFARAIEQALKEKNHG